MLAMLLILALQTPPVANETMGTNPNPPKSTKTTKTTKGPVHATHTKAEERSQSTTTTTSATTTTTHVTHRRKSSSSGRAFDYATRLASLLADTQDKAMVSAPWWQTVANEANALANKLYASTTGKNRTAAKEARTHVREMHAAAIKADAEGARSHAAMALPYVYRIIDASR